MSSQTTVTARFHAPPEDLQRYFTSFYITEIVTLDGAPAVDALQPEWGNLRFFSGASPHSWIDGGDHINGKRFVATGPSSRCANFSIGTSRFWGMGLLPLGWARFVCQPASAHANLITDGHTHPSFRPFVPLADALFTSGGDEEEELARIIAFFRAFAPCPKLDEARVQAIHSVLIDPQVSSVGELVERVGTSQRTVERVCDRAFGFSPKLLLRRQRFMRSLAQFMLDPSLRWIGAMDSQYHDQAQFVRDFREFMGMTPSDYASRPHPVLEQFIHARARTHGVAVQTMDGPGGARRPAA